MHLALMLRVNMPVMIKRQSKAEIHLKKSMDEEIITMNKPLCSVGGSLKTKTDFVSPQQIRNSFIEKNPKRHQSLNFHFRLTFYIPPEPRGLSGVRTHTPLCCSLVSRIDSS